MIRNERIRVGLRTMRFAAIERMHDTLAILVPVFVMTGMIVGCCRLWFWLFGFDALLRAI